jgi:hypothetical protein
MMVIISANWAGFSMRRSSTSFSKSVSWFESRLIFSDGFLRFEENAAEGDGVGEVLRAAKLAPTEKKIPLK